jgi:hypothetical protein
MRSNPEGDESFISVHACNFSGTAQAAQNGVIGASAPAKLRKMPQRKTARRRFAKVWRSRPPLGMPTTADRLFAIFVCSKVNI